MVHHRRRISPMQMERFSKPASDLFGYYLGWAGTCGSGSYSGDEYNPALSDNIVPHDAVKNLLDELNANEFVALKIGIWFWMIAQLVIVACMMIPMGILLSSIKRQTYSRTSKLTTTTGSVEPQTAMMGIIVMMVLGLVAIIVLAVFMCIQRKKFNACREFYLAQIINKHQQEVFAHLQCTVSI